MPIIRSTTALAAIASGFFLTQTPLSPEIFPISFYLALTRRISRRLSFQRMSKVFA